MSSGTQLNTVKGKQVLRSHIDTPGYRSPCEELRNPPVHKHSFKFIINLNRLKTWKNRLATDFIRFLLQQHSRSSPGYVGKLPAPKTWPAPHHLVLVWIFMDLHAASHSAVSHNRCHQREDAHVHGSSPVLQAQARTCRGLQILELLLKGGSLRHAGLFCASGLTTRRLCPGEDRGTARGWHAGH